jgi:hypothetical protein
VNAIGTTAAFVVLDNLSVMVTSILCVEATLQARIPEVTLVPLPVNVPPGYTTLYVALFLSLRLEIAEVTSILM